MADRIPARLALLGLASLGGALLLGTAAGRYTQAGITSFYQDHAAREREPDNARDAIQASVPSLDVAAFVPTGMPLDNAFAPLMRAGEREAARESAAVDRRERALDRAVRYNESADDSAVTVDLPVPVVPARPDVQAGKDADDSREPPPLPGSPAPPPLP